MPAGAPTRNATPPFGWWSAERKRPITSHQSHLTLPSSSASICSLSAIVRRLPDDGWFICGLSRRSPAAAGEGGFVCVFVALCEILFVFLRVHSRFSLRLCTFA